MKLCSFHEAEMNSAQFMDIVTRARVGRKIRIPWICLGKHAVFVFGGRFHQNT